MIVRHGCGALAQYCDRDLARAVDGRPAHHLRTDSHAEGKGRVPHPGFVNRVLGVTVAAARVGELVGELPPNFFPYITEQDPDWHARYQIYNRPGEYHNGGVWPFTLGFYLAAIVAAGFPELAWRKLAALTKFVRNARNSSLAFGFNEWVRARDGVPCGEDWQSWSAAMYLYAAACVEQKRVLLF